MSIALLTAISVVTAGLSYFKALSGLGAGGQLIPIYIWLGLSIAEAKAYALLAITSSLTSATFDNFRANRVELRLGVPIIVTAVVFAPVGAKLSLSIPDPVMKALFAAFLIYAGINALRPKRKRLIDDSMREGPPRLFILSAIGLVAGLFSGLLGVGGGGVIAPLMLSMGYQAKRVAVITALAAPLAALTGFVSYAAAGTCSGPLIGLIGITAAIGGYAGNRTMHGFMPERTVRYLIGVMSLLFAAKMISDLLE